jgi:diguanylate cyclase (GGDEF)-like protein
VPRWLPVSAREFVSGVLHHPAKLAADDAVEGRIRAEQINNIKRYLSSMMLANACNASVLVIALWSSPQRQMAIVWASVILLFTIYHGLRHLTSTRAIVRAVRNAALLGSLWAVLPLLFFSNASAGGQVIIACLCAGMLGGGAFAFASIPAAAIAFTTPIVIGSAIAIGRSGEAAYILVSVLMVSYITVLLKGVFVHSAQIATRVTAQVQAERRVRRDELTALPNRLAFYEGLEAAFARLARTHEQFAVLYFDLNDFKEVNDKFGHATGDKLLVHVGERLRECARDIDLVSRLSGDEFAVIAAHTTSPEDATALAKRIISSLDTPLAIDEIELCASGCIGIAFAPADGANPEALLKSADEALYAAKHGTGGAVQIYNSEFKEHTRRRRSLERDLRSALRRNEFFLVFQPILSLRDNRISGNEALLRWRHPSLGVRTPTELMSIIEETGLIHEIGNWVIREACKGAATWPESTRVAVNISPTQLRKVGLLSCVVNALTESRLQPGRLELEITESALVDDSEFVLSNLKALRELGVRIALDDFGTGYSSLTYLKKLSPNCVKIDGSFVRDVLTNAGCASIIRSVIGLSRDLCINVVAEGIESAEQLAFLRSCDCDEGQGFFISKPMSANDLLEFISGNGAAGANAGPEKAPVNLLQYRKTNRNTA